MGSRRARIGTGVSCPYDPLLVEEMHQRRGEGAACEEIRGSKASLRFTI